MIQISLNKRNFLNKIILIPKVYFPIHSMQCPTVIKELPSMSWSRLLVMAVRG